MDRENNVLADAAQAYLNDRERSVRQLQEQFDRLKPAANRVFSTEDGKILARQMIKACHLLETEQTALSPEALQRLQAQKDFVNLFITRLVDRSVFIGIIEGI